MSSNDLTTILFCLVIAVAAIAIMTQVQTERLSRQIKENRIILDAIRNYLSEQLKNNQK